MNSIYVRAYRLENCSIGYFTILKQFNAVHRVVLGLCSLALTSLVLIRREATVAYSNCLAYNQIDR